MVSITATEPTLCSVQASRVPAVPEDPSCNGPPAPTLLSDHIFCGLDGDRSARRLIVRSVLLTVLLLAVTATATGSVDTPARPQVLSSLMLDVTQAGPDLVAVGDRGYVLRSDDGGRSWWESHVGDDVLLTAVDFPSAQVGYAVGHASSVFKSENGGRTWRRLYHDNTVGPLLDVLFFDASVGFAVGAYGQLLQTTDGGHAWQDRSDLGVNPDELHLHAIAQLDSDTVMVVGEGGLILRSSNRGQSWQRVASPYIGSLFGIVALTDELLIYGLRGHLYSSADQGESWTERATGTTQTFFSSGMTGAGRPLLLGAEGLILQPEPPCAGRLHIEQGVTLTGLVLTGENHMVLTSDRGVVFVPFGQLRSFLVCRQGK